MTTSTKWRINVTANNGSTAYLGVSELQFRTVPGTPEPFAGGTFTASSEDYLDNALEAIDGDSTTYWSTQFNTLTGWLQYEYASAVEILSYALGSIDSAATKAPKDWTLEYWDGSAWQVADTRSGQSWTNSTSEVREYVVGGGATVIRSVNTPPDPTGTSKTSWRLNVSQSIGNYYTFLGEIQFRTAIGAALPFAGGTAVASTEYLYSDQSAAKASDGNAATFWQSEFGRSTHPADWWRYDYAGAVEIVAYAIQAQTTYSGYAPENFTLEYWSGTAWVVADTQTGQTGWGAVGIREYTVGTPGYAALANMDGTVVEINGTIALPALTLAGASHLDSDIVLPPLALDGYGVVAYAVAPSSGDVTLPSIQLSGSLESALRLPRFTITATGMNGTVGSGSLALPSMALSGSLDGPLALPVMSVAASGLTGEVLNGAAAIRSPTVSGESLTGMLGIGAAVLPQWLVAGDSGAGGDISLLELSIDASGLTGGIGSGAILLSKLDLSGSLRQDGDGDGNIAFSALALDAAATSTAVIDGAVTLGGIAVDGVAFVGNAANGSLTLPLWSVSADGHSSEIGIATVVMPVLALDGVLVSTVAAPVFTGVVLNTRTNAVTTYSGGAFNSLCNFNGLVLAATSTGIIALMGDTDQGAQIDAYLTSGVSDFQSDKFKRVIAGYVGYRAAGDMELTLITDEHHEYIYRIEPRQTAIHPSKVKFGRGCDGLYWQWRLSNRSGADFSLDSLRLDAEVLSRRV